MNNNKSIRKFKDFNMKKQTFVSPDKKNRQNEQNMPTL